jgi:hypothetical protein
LRQNGAYIDAKQRMSVVDAEAQVHAATSFFRIRLFRYSNVYSNFFHITLSAISSRMHEPFLADSGLLFPL